ncbi:unnamed protein product [Cuscuta europaea]|uniref:Uncharacterized protein n=1 Tax=Cuscuta europaea TaxID=41803 RepID=A0A9P0ZDW9_CUSEU|nr:unnamed protein product [Cuscuta europaea]
MHTFVQPASCIRTTTSNQRLYEVHTKCKRIRSPACEDPSYVHLISPLRQKQRKWKEATPEPLPDWFMDHRRRTKTSPEFLRSFDLAAIDAGGAAATGEAATSEDLLPDCHIVL